MAKSEATLIIKVKNLATKPIKGIKSGILGLNDAVKRASTKMSSFGKNLKKNIADRFVITASDIVGALKSIGAAIVNFAKTASEFKAVEMAFQNLAASQGQDADKMLAKMRELSLGTVSDLQLMKSANQALLLGLPVERFGDMLTIARSASKATGESMEFMLNSIVTGLGRGSKLVLDNLGIVFKLEDAYQEYADTLGITTAEMTEAQKKQAFLNKALATGVENAKAAGKNQVDLKDRMDQANASFENASVILGDLLLPAFKETLRVTAEVTNGFITWATTNKKTIQTFLLWAKDGFLNFVDSMEDLAAKMGVIAAGLTIAVTEAFKLNGKKAVQTIANTAVEIARIDTETKQKILDREKATFDKLNSMGDEQGELELKRQQSIIQKKAEAALAEKEAQDTLAEEKAMLDFEKSELELEKLGIDEDAKLQLLIKSLDKQLTTEKDHTARMALMKKKADTLALITENKKNALRVESQKGTFDTIATLANSNNKTLASIGKAALIAQKAIAIKDIAIQTPKAISKTMSAFPAPFNFALAAGVGVAMAAQAANVAGVQLAEGGIVPASTGGTLATIGEGGRDEAVIPLDEGGGGGIGSTVNITVNGGLLGDEASAKEFAEAVDAELFKLRQGNESVSFDEGVV